jgi:outer membrane murein-binding lipoprotein Lpp
MKRFFICVAVLAVFCISSCYSKAKTDQEIIAEYVQDRFFEIDQLRGGKSSSLSDAEATLYCWAFDGGFDDISYSELKEAISIVLACNDEVRDLISSIDDIDLDDYR